VADYIVPATHVAIHAKTLVADTQDTVTFTSADLTEVEILTDGVADIYVRIGTGSAAVEGTQCWRVPAGSGSAVLPVHTSGDTVIKLISAGTPKYSVGRT
jgi:hypothetical protein